MHEEDQFVFFALPDDVISLLFRQWLGIMDFIHLDTALCSHFPRKEYFRILQLINGIVTTDSRNIAQNVLISKPSASASIIKWLTKRKLFFSQWNLQPEDTFHRYHMFQVFGVSNLKLLLDFRHFQSDNREEALINHFQTIADMLKLRNIFWEQNKFSFNLSYPEMKVTSPDNERDTSTINLSNWPHDTPTKQPFHILQLSNHATTRYNQPAIVINNDAISLILPYLSSLQTLILDNVCFQVSTALQSPYAMLSEHCQSLRVLYFSRNEINLSLLISLFAAERVLFPLLETFITDGCFYPDMEPEDPPLDLPRLLSNEFQPNPNNLLLHLKRIETECLLASLLVQLAPNIAHFDISYIWDWYGQNYQYLPLQAFADHLYRSYHTTHMPKSDVSRMSSPSLQVLRIAVAEMSSPSSMMPWWLNTQFFRPIQHGLNPWSNMRELHFNGNCPLQEDMCLRHLLPNIPKYMKQLQELSILCIGSPWNERMKSELRFTSYNGEMDVCCSVFRQYEDMYETRDTSSRAENILADGVQTFVMLWLLDLAKECTQLTSLKLHDVYPLSFQFALQQFHKQFPNKSTFFPKLTSFEVSLSRGLVSAICTNKTSRVQGFSLTHTFPSPTSLPPIDICPSDPLQGGLVKQLFSFASLHSLTLVGTWLTDADVLPFFEHFNVFPALLASSASTTSVSMPSCRLRKLALHSPKFTSKVCHALLRMVLSCDSFCRELRFLSCHAWSDFSNGLYATETVRSTSEEVSYFDRAFQMMAKGVLHTMSLTVFLPGLKELRLFNPSGGIVHCRAYESRALTWSLKEMLNKHTWRHETSMVLQYLQTCMYPTTSSLSERPIVQTNDTLASLASLFFVSRLRGHVCGNEFRPVVTPTLCSYKNNDIMD